MIESGAWRYLHASVQGTSHGVSGTPCQDSSLVQLLSTSDGDPVLVLAAADGAGTAARADAGSRMACAAFIEAATLHLRGGGRVEDIREDVARAWILGIREKLRGYAADWECAARDLACTLLGAVAGPSWAVFVQLGDGAIVVADGDDYRPVFWPQAGEYANTTFFITDEDAASNCLIASAPVADEIAIFTDGLQMLALRFEARTAHTPFFKPMFTRLRAEAPGEAHDLTVGLEQFLNSDAVNRRTDDDKTLVLATRRPAISAPAEVRRTTETIPGAPSDL